MADQTMRLWADDPARPGKLALCRGWQLIDYWPTPPDPFSGPGAVHLARLEQLFPDHRRGRVRLADGAEASFRLPARHQLKAGQLIFVTLSAEAASGKPLQASVGIQLAGRAVVLLVGEAAEKLPDEVQLPDGFGVIWRRRAKTLPIAAVQAEIDRLLGRWAERLAEPPDLLAADAPAQLLTAADLREEAALAAPQLELLTAEDASWPDWQEQASAACDPELVTASGFVLHFGQTRALTAIDVDSAASRLAAADRLEEICRAVMDAVRLRRLSGLILLDMPRLQKRPQQRCFELLRKYAGEDPRHPEILGLGPAGLIEMTVRRQRRPLEQLA